MIVSQSPIDMPIRSVLRSYNIKRASQLSKALVTLDKSNYKGKNEKSIKSFLSQVISGKRRLTDELESSLVLSIKHINAESEINEEALVSDLRNAFHTTFSKTREEIEKQKFKPISTDQLNYYDWMVKAGSLAKTILIITAEPAEIKDSWEAVNLKDELLKRLKILPTAENTNKDVKYTFIFPKLRNSYFLALQFWEGLVAHGKFRGINNIEDILKEKNSGPKPSIEVLIIEGEWGIDVGRIIIDEGLPSEIGFVCNYSKFPYSKEEKLNVMVMGLDTISRALKFTRKIREKHDNLQKFPLNKALEVLNTVY